MVYAHFSGELHLMNPLTEIALLTRMASWGLHVARPDTHYPSPLPANRKFMNPRQAVDLIGDGKVLAVSGLGAHQRASILYRAIRESFLKSAHPRRLTLVNIGGHGSRGLLAGTPDELAVRGLCTRFITGHFETFHSFLELAAAGGCELQCLPLGIIALLYDALAHGSDSVLSPTGVGTFLDPRVGRGSPVRGGREQLIEVEGEQLRYRMPPLDVALFNVPAADRHANLYVKDSAIVGDSHELAYAVKRNGGVVIANVGLLVDEGYDDVFLPGKMVDAVVYYPDTEQTAGFFHHDPWKAVTLDSGGAVADARAHARLIRRFGEGVGVLARRTAVHDAVARLAAFTLLTEVKARPQVALGAGLPEEIASVVFDCGRLEDVTFIVESGVVGGLPAPGAYFGAAFSPREIISTAQLFKRCYRKLDAACLGALQVDEAGNVNVSKRGRGVRRYAGPGGFTDFVTAARTIIFVSEWTRGGDIVVEAGTIRQRRPGIPKFVSAVNEVTFNGQQALRAGKRVFYATPVGLFRLTTRGMELSRIMPGIDVREDILAATPMRVVLPVGGEVPRLPQSIVTGAGFSPPRHAPSPHRSANRTRKRASA